MMTILQKLFPPKRKIDARLLGEWQHTAGKDATNANEGETTKMIFTNDGKLTYKMQEASRLQQMNLVFYTKGDYIVSNQPSHLAEEATKYWFDGDNCLHLEYDGIITTYTKC